MLVIGVAGTELTAQERDWLQHDACAGVILFTRNFASQGAGRRAVAGDPRSRAAPQLICVDQEGGRVQRFREGYSALAAAGRLRQAVRAAIREAALKLAEEHAWLMASEMRATGVDLSFAPVVDLGRGNRAIGNRAFSDDPTIVAEFTRAYVRGMHAAGMAATLKHFPGHGSVLEDTHFDDAVDPRTLEEMRAHDLMPVRRRHRGQGRCGDDGARELSGRRAGTGRLFAALDRRHPAQGDWAFRGVVFSDDIGMAAAFSAGGIKAAHRRAPGCRLRRGAGLPSGAGRGIAGGGRRSQAQHHGADRR